MVKSAPEEAGEQAESIRAALEADEQMARYVTWGIPCPHKQHRFIRN